MDRILLPFPALAPCGRRNRLADASATLFGQRRAPDGSVVADNFARWFGNSKVVDAAGKPLVLYHGTKADFAAFDIKHFGASDEGLAGKGFYFTYNPEEASGYSLNEQFGKGDAPNVRPVYLALDIPLTITNGVLPDGRKLSDVHRGVGNGVGITSAGGAAVRKLAEDGGHDGVMWVSADGAVRHVVALRPDQIKSAIGNSGAFDRDSDDLTDSQAWVEAQAYADVARERERTFG